MAFTKLKLTTFGQSIEAKSHQGKGLNFTRVAIGDGLLGSGSMINRTTLVSEKLSLKIDGIVATDSATQSAVIATLDNSLFSEGFFYRELALFAKDPDTGTEGVYLYDNAGEECEYLDTQSNGVVIYERIKMLITVSQDTAITFEASGNPIYLSAEDVSAMLAAHNADETAHPAKADLVDGRVPLDQAPLLFVIGDTEPESGPVFWFNTSGVEQASAEAALLTLSEDGSEVSVEVEDAGTYSVENATVDKDAAENTYNFDLI